MSYIAIGIILGIYFVWSLDQVGKGKIIAYPGIVLGYTTVAIFCTAMGWLVFDCARDLLAH